MPARSGRAWAIAESWVTGAILARRSRAQPRGWRSDVAFTGRPGGGDAMVNQLSSYPAAARQRFAELVGEDRSLRAWVRTVMLAGLPVAILVGSPQRNLLSAVIAGAYVAA